MMGEVLIAIGVVIAVAAVLVPLGWALFAWPGSERWKREHEL